MLAYNGSAQRRIRRACEVRSEELSALTGRSSTMLRNYELGRVEPKVSTASAIAQALGCQLADLLVEVTPDEADDSAELSA